MISPISGEVAFSEGLCFGPQAQLAASLRLRARSREIPLLHWTQHLLGVLASDHGPFEVEIVVDLEGRIQCVFVAHAHSFYEEGTPNDAERRVFHDSVLGTDLHGQREFSWGQAFCRLDTEENKDWLVVLYTPGPPAPRAPGEPPVEPRLKRPEPTRIVDAIFRRYRPPHSR